jgi:Integrase core domain
MTLRRIRQAAAQCLIESFSGGLRDEPLNKTLFTLLAHVRDALAIWKDDYNTPHDTLPLLQVGLARPYQELARSGRML